MGLDWYLVLSKLPGFVPDSPLGPSLTRIGFSIRSIVAALMVKSWLAMVGANEENATHKMVTIVVWLPLIF